MCDTNLVPSPVLCAKGKSRRLAMMVFDGGFAVVWVGFWIGVWKWLLLVWFEEGRGKRRKERGRRCLLGLWWIFLALGSHAKTHSKPNPTPLRSVEWRTRNKFFGEWQALKNYNVHEKRGITKQNPCMCSYSMGLIVIHRYHSSCRSVLLHISPIIGKIVRSWSAWNN